MSTTNCNCGGDCSSDCPNCGEADCKDDKFLLTKVRETSANTDPCVEGANKDCPVKEPRFDVLTLDFTLPAITKTGALYVCDPEIYSLGQWIRLPGGVNGTVVQITGIDEDKLTVRNSCSDGLTAVSTNKNAGETFPKGSEIYVTGEPVCNLLANLCGEVVTCLKNSDGICFEKAKTLGEDEKAHLFGGTLDQDCTGGNSVLSSCLRKVADIYAFGKTLCFPQIPEVNGNKVDGAKKQFGVFEKGGCGSNKENCFKMLEIGTDGFYRICDGDIKFINNARAPIVITRKELVNVTIQHNEISGWSTEVDLPDVPEDCGAGLCVQLECQVFALTLTSADLFKWELLANEQEFALIAGNEQFNAPGVSFPGTANGTTIVCGIENKKVKFTTNVENGQLSGSAKIQIWATMYYV